MAIWEENKHPRDKSGQFTSKGNEGQGRKKEETKKITKEIKIDDDYERSYGPAPDKEDDPEGYKKYMDSYKKWQNDNFDNDDIDINEVVSDNEYVYLGIKDKDQFVDLLHRRDNVPIDKAKEWVEKNWDEYQKYQEEEQFDNDFEEEFIENIDNIDYDKAEENEKKNANKGRKSDGSLSDEAFKIGQKGAKTYLDFMTQYNDLDKLKGSNIFLGGLQSAVSKAITEAGYNPNFELTYKDFNDVVGSVLGEEVDYEEYERNATKGFTGKKYQNKEEEPQEDKNNTPDELNQIFNNLTKKYNMSEDDYWKLVRTIEKANKSFGKNSNDDLPF